MYSIALKTYIRNAGIEAVSRIWEEPSVLQKYATNIKHLSVVKRQGNVLRTHWEVDIQGAVFSWDEEDILEPKNGIIRFSMKSGDFGGYWGTWRIIPLRSGSIKIELKANYDWGIPVLEPYVRETLQRKTKLMLKGLLKAIKQTAEDYGS